MLNRIINNIKGDKVIWIIAILLSIYSIIAVYSASTTLSYIKQGGATEYYLFKHLFIIIFGLILMYITQLIKYTKLSKIAQILLIITIPLLIITILTGESINDANRWIKIPILNLTFQSSDLAKLSLILYLSRILSKKQDNIKDLKKSFIPIIIPIVIVCGLILPSNFSTAALIFSSCLILMFIGRVNMKYIILIIGSGLIFFSLVILVNPGRSETWINRVRNFSKSDKNYLKQDEMAKTAIATTSFFGKGPGNSTQKNVLPQAYSDFIFAIIIEEFGIALGGFFLIFLYLMLFLRCIKIVNKSPGTFGAFLVFGFSFLITFQAFLNMGVAVGLLPVTGQSLPLISMGGTSIWFSSISIGIILSVSKETDINKEFENE